MKHFAISLVIFAALAVGFIGCSRTPAKISITNGSSLTISNIWVSSPHFAMALGTMTPGMSMNFALQSRSETGIWLTYETAGHKFDSRSPAKPNYFQASSRHPLSLHFGTDLPVRP